MLDRYTETDVRRISPEAPVPIASVLRRWAAPGGAANVARNISGLGAPVTLLGARAKDNDGQTLQDLLDAQSIMAPATIFSDRPTTCKSRILAHGQQLLRLDEEDAKPFSAEVVDRLWHSIERALPWAECVILSDYGKGLFASRCGNDLLTHKIIQYCKAHNQPVLIDPRGTDWSPYSGADCLTPNTRELANVLRLDTQDFREICKATFSLMKALHIPRILLTRGAKGMALLEGNGSILEIPTKAHEVSDVSGAGDTVIAILALCVTEQNNWKNAAKVANIGAGIVVSKVGTSPIGRDELLRALASDSTAMAPSLNLLTSKIVSQTRLRELVDEWRRNHERIVFTNGCFDLIHPGHVQLLQEAASLGDRLIVALNSDSSVQRLKGPNRPIQNENARALVMAGLDGVDSVIVFEEDTPLNIIKLVCPDILVKGGDYKGIEIVGADFVEKNGGKVHLVEIAEGFSTTNIVHKSSENSHR
ncbi:MAG: D-glycero-beta-D-manno-heptose 1-phosphate adenylyltransferase [Desulfovibrio sp.]|nr:D-glycero-beta-D-manno-heptose 1-phosphate adenylyltransferase [Desulfovibrio sp.]